MRFALLGGRRGGKTAAIRWARDMWQDWDWKSNENCIFRLPGEDLDVCPTCYYRWDLAATGHEPRTTLLRLRALIMTAPPPKGPFRPEGIDKAEGCRCWRGLTNDEAAAMAVEQE